MEIPAITSLPPLFSLPPFLIVLCCISLPAQQSAPIIPPVETTVVVLGNPLPVTQAESSRTVSVFDTQQNRLAFEDPESYLRLDASADIQQRAPAGILADISVRGASFEQTLVLLNGLRINDVETSHFNLDLPVPLNALGSIDLLHGAGSTLYGSDAIGGVVEFLTWKPQSTSLRLRTGVGSYGENQQAVSGSFVTRKATEVLTGGRDFSSGFIADRDYRSEAASSETFLQTLAGTSDLLLAGNDRSYGANQFYGPFTSRERTKAWFAALTQHLTQQTEVAVAYRRHSDIFLLFQDQPAGYKNQHIDDGFEGTVRDQRSLKLDLSLSTGVEVTTDQIASTNLGHHGRNRGAGYAAAEWLKPGHASVSLGGREEVFSGGRTVFSPTTAGTLWLARNVSLHGSIGYGFRIPTFLDLYYFDPATLGNPRLKPESAWNYDAGVNWYSTATVSTSLNLFYSNQTNTIDYTRATPSDKYQATNLPGLHFAGVEAAFDWQPQSTQRLHFSWSNLNGAKSGLHGLESRYVFNYAVNNGRAEWSWNPRHLVLLDTRLGVVQRLNRDPYAVLDLSIVRERGRVHPYLEMTNLTNSGYEEIQGVRMQGRSFIGGVEVALNRKHPKTIN
jgi:vitamin B12 transporter